MTNLRGFSDDDHDARDLDETVKNISPTYSLRRQAADLHQLVMDLFGDSSSPQCSRLAQPPVRVPDASPTFVSPRQLGDINDLPLWQS
jgi:hypothetical protein